MSPIRKASPDTEKVRQDTEKKILDGVLTDDPFQNLPTAEEARAAVDLRRNRRRYDEEARAVKEIMAAIEDGSTHVQIHPPLVLLSVKQRLHDMGYFVRNVSTGPNETSTEVSW